MLKPCFHFLSPAAMRTAARKTKQHRIRHFITYITFARNTTPINHLFLFAKADRSVILLFVFLPLGIFKMLKSASQKHNTVQNKLLDNAWVVMSTNAFDTLPSVEVVWFQQWGMHINSRLTNHMWSRGFLHRKHENRKQFCSDFCFLLLTSNFDNLCKL